MPDETARGTTVDDSHDELRRLVARDYGAQSPLYAQIEAVLGDLDRTREQNATLLRETATLRQSFADLEAGVLDAFNETRVQLAAQKVLYAAPQVNGSGE